MASLVLAEHNNQALNDATAKTVTAAAAISTPVHILVAGQNCAGVADAAAKIAGVEKVLLADDAAYARMMAETMETLILSVAGTAMTPSWRPPPPTAKTICHALPPVWTCRKFRKS